MEWKIINGYPNYAVNKNGEIKSLRYNRILKSAKSDSGYTYVNLSNNKIIKTNSVHKLVMEHFGEEKHDDNLIIDHIDGCKSNNKIENLQWLSIKSNTEKFYNNFDKKIKIVELHKQNYSVKEICKLVEMSQHTVRQTILKM
jgi:hypothetical protein